MRSEVHSTGCSLRPKRITNDCHTVRCNAVFDFAQYLHKAHYKGVTSYLTLPVWGKTCLKNHMWAAGLANHKNSMHVLLKVSKLQKIINETCHRICKNCCFERLTMFQFPSHFIIHLYVTRKSYFHNKRSLNITTSFKNQGQSTCRVAKDELYIISYLRWKRENVKDSNYTQNQKLENRECRALPSMNMSIHLLPD